jgi:hypothetical protein
MLKKILLGAAMALLVSCGGGGGDEPPSTRVTTVAACGDSVRSGEYWTGTETKRMSPTPSEMLQQVLGPRYFVIDCSAAGASIVTYPRLPAADVTLLQFIGADAVMNTDPVLYELHLAERIVTTPGRVIVVGAPRLPDVYMEQIDRFNPIARRVAERTATEFVPLDDIEGRYIDHIHPDRAAQLAFQRRIAAQIVESIPGIPIPVERP